MYWAGFLHFLLMEKGDLVRITWLDADSEAGWTAHDPEADDIGECLISYGLFVSKGHKFLTISACYNKDSDEWLSKHRIPVAMVVNSKVLDR